MAGSIDLMPFVLGLMASVATSFGGLLALRFRAQLKLILALTAGIVIGIASFELIPEALHLAGDEDGLTFVLTLVVLGFALLLILDRVLRAASDIGTRLRAHLTPASLTFHSLVDGAGIALAYRISPEIGWSVAIAVLGHDLADGANVVGASLPNGARSARGWLLLNGAAPLLGVGLTYLIDVPMQLLIALLAGLAGAFLYIGTSELLPTSFRTDRVGITATSAFGFALVYLGTRFA